MPVEGMECVLELILQINHRLVPESISGVVSLKGP